ncbi:MAG: prephenate dehydratase [Lachnospiraceae bacterium]|nr:prephenate dehydratase [Lachnospiraceae bacterium]
MVVDLIESREKIDKIDKEIERLFEERMDIANDVAAYKRSTGKKVYDPERENEKIKTLVANASSEFNKTAVEDLFRQIMSISRKYQYQKLGSAVVDIPFKMVDSLDYDRDTKVVFFGDRGAYSEQAMLEFFNEGVDSYNRTTFAEVIDDVINYRAKYGVVPIENTSTGGITDIYDLLVNTDVNIVAEHVVKVEHALLALPGTKKENIKKVYSHPQAISQCKDYLSENTNMEPEKYLSTAGAAKKVKDDGDLTQAAIGSERAAEVYGLEVLERKINTQSTNSTRFIIISNQKVFLKDANKISLSFEIKHEAGSLYNILANFYYNNLNMTKIESRPIEGKNWEYRFIVDVEGNLNDAGVSNAIESLKESSEMKILGNIITK